MIYFYPMHLQTLTYDTLMMTKLKLNTIMLLQFNYFIILLHYKDNTTPKYPTISHTSEYILIYPIVF